MSDVVVIGGGLSGLAAAWELERAGVDYTLIEVKGRLGGSIISEQRGAIIFDGGPFALAGAGDWSFLADLGLEDALFDIAPDRIAFKAGTAVLVEALAARLSPGRIIHRMAVSTLGALESRYSICLENGMVRHAAGVIVAAPARYAERLFYPLVPPISEQLRGFHYDSITRVSLTLPAAALTLPLQGPPDAGFAFGYVTSDPHRVPPGDILLQVGLRYRPTEQTDPADVVRALCDAMRWPDPTAWRVDHWPESHLLPLPDHDARMDTIESLLPPRIRLLGSDYRTPTIAARVPYARAAARSLIDTL